MNNVEVPAPGVVSGWRQKKQQNPRQPLRQSPHQPPRHSQHPRQPLHQHQHQHLRHSQHQPQHQPLHHHHHQPQPPHQLNPQNSLPRLPSASPGRVRSGVLAAAAVMVASLLVSGVAGCAQPPTQQAEQYRAPAWMAQVRQQQDAENAKFFACLSSFGVAEQLRLTGAGQTAILTPSGLSEEEEAAFQRTIDSVSEQCEAVTEEQSAPPTTADYNRMLELRECLIAEGYPTPEPPSEAVWLQQFTQPDKRYGIWNPYIFLSSVSPSGEPLDGATPVSDEVFIDLNQRCVQPVAVADRGLRPYQPGAAG